jgi:hypothetical protein
MKASGGRHGRGSGEMEAHREGLPMAAWPGRRSTAVVVGLGGHGGARQDIGVRGTGAELAVAKPGVDGGQRWRPAWRRFRDGEGDGRLMDGGS